MEKNNNIADTPHGSSGVISRRKFLQLSAGLAGGVLTEEALGGMFSAENKIASISGRLADYTQKNPALFDRLETLPHSLKKLGIFEPPGDLGDFIDDRRQIKELSEKYRLGWRPFSLVRRLLLDSQTQSALEDVHKLDAIYLDRSEIGGMIEKEINERKKRPSSPESELDAVNKRYQQWVKKALAKILGPQSDLFVDKVVINPEFTNPSYRIGMMEFPNLTIMAQRGWGFISLIGHFVHEAFHAANPNQVQSFFDFISLSPHVHRYVVPPERLIDYEENLIPAWNSVLFSEQSSLKKFLAPTWYGHLPLRFEKSVNSLISILAHKGQAIPKVITDISSQKSPLEKFTYFLDHSAELTDNDLKLDEFFTTGVSVIVSTVLDELSATNAEAAFLAVPLFENQFLTSLKPGAAYMLVNPDSIIADESLKNGRAREILISSFLKDVLGFSEVDYKDAPSDTRLSFLKSLLDLPDYEARKTAIQVKSQAINDASLLLVARHLVDWLFTYPERDTYGKLIFGERGWQDIKQTTTLPSVSQYKPVEKQLLAKVHCKSPFLETEVSNV